MRRVKDIGLVVCLFVFLLLVVGGGLHLTSGAALLSALTGTPLVIHVFRCRVRGIKESAGETTQGQGEGTADRGSRQAA